MEKGKIDIKIDDDSNYLNRVYNLITRDEEVYHEIKKMGFSDLDIYNNISIFKEYFDDYYLNKKYVNFLDCKKDNKEYMVIPFKDEYNEITRRYTPLDAYKVYIDYCSKFIYRDFDDENISLDWSNLENSKVKKIISSQFKKSNWIYIKGALRTGKTYLAIGFSNRFVNNNMGKVAFCNTRLLCEDLINHYKDEKDHSEYNKRMNKLYDVDLLVLDDLGNENISWESRDLVLLPLLSERIRRNKLVFITSEFGINEISNLYAFNQKSSLIKAEQMKRTILMKVEGEILTSIDSLY